MTDPVVQVIDESNGEVVYTLRTRGTTFRPKVFAEGRYSVKVGEQGGKMKLPPKLAAEMGKAEHVVRVAF